MTSELIVVLDADARRVRALLEPLAEAARDTRGFTEPVAALRCVREQRAGVLVISGEDGALPPAVVAQRARDLCPGRPLCIVRIGDTLEADALLFDRTVQQGALDELVAACAIAEGAREDEPIGQDHTVEPGDAVDRDETAERDPTAERHQTAERDPTIDRDPTVDRDPTIDRDPTVDRDQARESPAPADAHVPAESDAPGRRRSGTFPAATPKPAPPSAPRPTPLADVFARYKVR